MNEHIDEDIRWVLDAQAERFDPDTDAILDAVDADVVAPLDGWADAARARTIPKGLVALGAAAAVLIGAFVVGRAMPGADEMAAPAREPAVTADPRTTDSDEAAISQTGEVKTGDAMAGAQVTGAVADNVTVQDSNKSVGAAALAGSGAAANNANANFGPSALSAGPGQTSQVGDDNVQLGSLGAGGNGIVLNTQGPDQPSDVIRTAQLDLVVGGNGFDDAWGRVNAIATKHSGHVSNSSARRGDEGLSHGTVTIRVPADAFTTALDELRELGEVDTLEVSSRDVSGEFVDIDARLRALNTQEEALLELLTRAESIDDTLTIRDRIDGVRTEIEELTGRRNALSGQVDLATIHMEISAERNEEEPEPTAEEPGLWERLGFAGAADRALDGGASVVRGLIVFAGYAVPLGLLVALLYIGYRSARSRRYAFEAADAE